MGVPDAGADTFDLQPVSEYEFDQPEASAWDTIRQDWDCFMDLVRKDQPPPLTKRDTVIRNDREWIAAAQKYIATKQRADETTAELDALKQQLIGLAQHSSEHGGGVSVSRYWKTGTIDYKKILELRGLNLEPYRGPEREETRITVQK